MDRAGPPEPRRRRRPALACVDCRRRKIKCDRNNPCAHCVATKTPCIYQPYRNGAGVTGLQEPTPAANPSPPRLLQHHGDITGSETLVSGSVFAPASANDSFSASITAEQPSRLPAAPVLPGHERESPAARSAPSGTGTGGSFEADLREILRRLEKLEGLSASGSATLSAPSIPRSSENERDMLYTDGARQSGIQDAHHISLNKTRTLRWNHLLGNALEFDAIGNCYMEAVGMADTGTFRATGTREVVAEVGALLRRCKTVARRLKAGRPGRGGGGGGSPDPPGVSAWSSSSGAASLLLPPPAAILYSPVSVSREVADAMAALYFRTFESTHRILHRPSFWAEYARFWEGEEQTAEGEGGGQAGATELRLKVLLVVALGSSMAPGDGGAGLDRGLIERWIYAAQTWLAGPLEKDRLSAGALQVHCLLILARQVFSVGGDLVWAGMGALVHHAMQMGFHRDPTHLLPPVSALQAEVRRRLWATVLEMVLQASLDAAMPPRVSLDEFDTLPPSNVDDDELHEGVSMARLASLSRPRTEHTGASLQLLLMDSLATRLRVLGLLNRLSSEIAYGEALRLSGEITDACAAASAFALRHAGLVTPFHRNMVDYLVRRFLIPLHCPFAIQARTANPLFHYSAKVMAETALAIISPEPESELEQAGESDGFTRLLVSGGGLFKEGFRLALTAISMELLAQAAAQRREGTLRVHARQREVLKNAVRDMMALSEERIRRGETNIKAYFFLRMVLAQAEAVEQGVEKEGLEEVIALAARDSALFCLDLLGKRAESQSLGAPGAPGSAPAYGMDVDESEWAIGGHEIGQGAYSGDVAFDSDFFSPDGGFY